MARCHNLVSLLLCLPSLTLIGLVRVYQWTLGPMLAGRCRFQPSCSEYFIGAVRKHGTICGVLRGIWRICRCNPWNPGGYDPP
ncbi:MAG: membrane protein insertion efficiency factor YidD [Thermoguttaceae bacterium]